MKILLFLLIPFLLVGQTYIDNILCDDNAATTVVSNDGTSANWVTNPNHTSSTYYSAVGTKSFDLDGNNYYIRSADSLSIQKLTIQWDERFRNANAAANEVHMIHGSVDGDATLVQGEWYLRRNTGSDEWRIHINDGVAERSKATTDHAPNNTTFYTYVLILDFTTAPLMVSLTIDGTVLTWGAWDTPPILTVINTRPRYFGLISVAEPDGYFKNILIWETVEDEDDGFSGFPKWGGFK